MKILKHKDSLHAVKPEGINVDYYLFNEYEVHYNEQEPNSTQQWHHHEKIWESIFVIEGQLTLRWRENNQEKSQVIKAGDLVETEREPHTFSNESKSKTRFLVIKQVLSGENKKEILKSDKILD